MMRQQIGATAILRSLGVCVAVVSALTIDAEQALAADHDIVNAGGFEEHPPYGFTTTFLGTGQLEGQVNPPGFGQSPPPMPPGQWLRPLGVQTGTGVVQSSVVKNGTQAVRIERVGNSPDRWGVPVNHLAYPDYPTPPVGEDAQPCLCINWDMLVEGPSGSGDDAFGPYFGVEANDDDVNGIHLLGSLGVDATTGEVLYQAPGSGNLTAAGPSAAFGTWHNYQIKLDYSTHEYTIRHDGVPLGTFAFVDGPNDQFSEANIFALPAAGDPDNLARAGIAYFDNFLVREGELCDTTGTIIPEPTAIALALLGMALVPQIARRQRRASF
jgi:hypothetical protein